MFSSLYSDLRKLRKVASPSEVKQIKQAHFQLLFKTKKEEKPKSVCPNCHSYKHNIVLAAFSLSGGKETYI